MSHPRGGNLDLPVRSYEPNVNYKHKSNRLCVSTQKAMSLIHCLHCFRCGEEGHAQLCVKIPEKDPALYR